jgi:hypothetical protein
MKKKLILTAAVAVAALVVSVCSDGKINIDRQVDFDGTDVFF